MTEPVVRQPVFDRTREVAAYNLLVRGGIETVADATQSNGPGNRSGSVLRETHLRLPVGHSTSKLSYLRFLDEVNRPTLDLIRIQKLLEQDLSSSLKLFRYLNSAAFGWRQEVTSIRHALRLLGETLTEEMGIPDSRR